MLRGTPEARILLRNIMSIEDEANARLVDQESQVGPFVDFLLVRNVETGACGQASCLHVSFQGKDYAVTCHHVLKPKAEYYTGPHRLATDQITEEDDKKPGIPPLRLVADSVELDLALFEQPGLDLPSIPKRSYPLSEGIITFEQAEKNKGTVGYIYGVPGFATRGFQYPDETVYLSTPIYRAYGPIVSVEAKRITADFAERKLLELHTREAPQLEAFQVSGGARDLGGMSGSGLWVHDGQRFHLAGVLKGREPGSCTLNTHTIEFTPIWSVVQWIKSVLTTK